MSKQTFAFSGVFIPATVWCNENLTWLDRVVWAVINHCHDGESPCNLGDADIAEMLGETEMAINASILRLSEQHLVNAEGIDNENRIIWTHTTQVLHRETKQEESASTADVQRVLDLYNESCKTMPRAEKITPSRLRRVRAVLKERDENQFKALFLRAHSSDFLSGRSKKWTGCNIDWILAPANLPRIEEGVYDNRTVTSAPSRLPENLR